ncbi:MAG TPA: 3-hydroxyacyl-CoA dehydrogenase NAD-binding domain-containing protein [Bacillota bacterium]
MPESIRRVAVLGAGTMGAQIAILLASFGCRVDLLDMPPPDAGEGGDGSRPGSPDRNRLASQALERLRSLNPAPALHAGAYQRVQPGNFEDDLSRLAEADWVIEAVVERLEPKQALWARAAQHVRPDAVLSTNTSGISIAAIAGALPAGLRRRFLGTHFFNPPRYLRLLEVIPTADTDPEAVALIRRFGEERLGKGVVVARDTPNFIANRIGCYGLMVTLELMREFGLGPDEVDSITGTPMGRPRSATFRTLDIVGLDVFANVARNLQTATGDPVEREAFRLPGFFEQMLERGRLGEKAGQGFYRRVKEDGRTQILALDLDTLEYRPRRELQAPSLQALAGLDDPAERVLRLLAADDPAGRFAWALTRRVLLYTAAKAPEISDDLVSIDRAMRWGFGWELGPFELWDALGVPETVARMEAEGDEVPAWVRRVAEGPGAFYSWADGLATQATYTGDRLPVPGDPRVIDVPRLARETRVVRRNPGATLYDLGEEVLFLDFHSPKQAIGADMLQMISVALDESAANWRGLVISSHVRPNFCVGANLMEILFLAEEAEWDELDQVVRLFQGLNQRLRHHPRPVVVAPFGMTLGGGVELAFGADRVTAAAETYMGLVEVGAGLIPAGGGCKEMVLRAVQAVPGPAASGGGGGDPGALTGGRVDLQPLINRIFETIGLAKVAGSALEARDLGYLRPDDPVVPNLDHLLFRARQEVLALDAAGYRPPEPARIPVVGRDGRAVLETGAYQLHWAGYASEYDLHIARKLAHVLTGGEVDSGTLVSEQYLLDLEREAFLSLAGEPRTQARMRHILTTGKPLRN